MSDLNITATLNGVNLDAGQAANGYELHADTRSSVQTQWRKQTVANPYVEGEFDVLAVRQNITENVAVWVYGTTAGDFRQKVEFLQTSIAQPAFSLIWVTNDLQETWDCTYSEYVVETQQVFQMATLGVMRMSIVRRPSVTRSYSGGAAVIS